MRVPPRLRSVSENSTRSFHDSSNVIQKIGKESEVAIKSPLYEIYEVLNFDETLKAQRSFINRNNLSIEPLVRLVMNDASGKDQDSPNGVKLFLNNRYFHEDELPWQFPPPAPVTRRYNVDFGEAAIRAPTDDITYHGPHTPTSTSALWLAVPLCSFFIVFLLGILLRKIIRCFRAPQQNICRLIEQLEEQQRSRSNNLDTSSQHQNEDNLSVTLSVESEYSYTSDNETDMPPPYSECGTNNIATNNKKLDVTSEELPPPYSSCLGTLSNTDEIAKVHKGHSIEQSQSHADTDRNSVEQNDSNDETLNTVVETTADIDNRLVNDQSRSDTGNGNFE